MRVIGYCTGCRRIKMVKVTNYIKAGPVYTGICDSCDSKRKGK